MAHRLFVDESGNTGRDIYDLQQPLLTYAGVWLSPDGETSAGQELARLVALHRLQRGAELKGKTILNSRGGRHLVRDLLRWLKANRVPLIGIAQEKPFMAAAVLVEDATDPAYNDRYDNRWTWDTRLKEPLAGRIARSAPGHLLAEAWRARNGTDEQAFTNAYNALLFALTLSLDAEMAREAERMKRVNLQEIWHATERSRGTSGGYSPNFAAFTSLLMSAEQQAEALNLESVEVVHDEQRQYQAVFEEAWRIIRGNGTDQVRERLPNQSELIFGLRRLTSFRFADSVQHVGLQLADIAASALRVAIAEASSADRSRDYLPDLQALLADEVGTPYVIGSESWQLTTMTLMLGRDPRTRRA